jgi:uncharacterized membrane protein
MTYVIIGQYIGMLLFPFAIMELVKRNKMAGILGPVALSYVFGFLYSHFFPDYFNVGVSKNLVEFSVPTAIALLLFSTDFLAWLKYARKAMFSFGLQILSVVSCTLLAYWIFRGSHPELWKLGGMFTGVYIGGTPNLIAIGKMTQASEETIVIAQASDVFNSGIYFLLLLTVAQRLLLNFLPSFVPLADNPRDETFHYGRSGLELGWWETAQGMAFAFLLALGVFGASIGISILVSGSIEMIPVLLSVSTLSIGLSFISKVRNLPKTYEFGEYFICLFCLGLGSQTRFDELISGNISIFQFDTFIIWSSIALHFFLSWLMKIDADTTLITSTAGIFGPHFIGPVASVLKNKQIVVSGITTGLVGFAVANYIGLLISYILKNL